MHILGDIFVIIWVNIYFLKKYNVQISKFAEADLMKKKISYILRVNKYTISTKIINFNCYNKPILTPRLASFSLSSAMEFERSIR